MKNIVLQHKVWVIVTCISILAISAGELFKAYLIQLILDTATVGKFEQFQKTILLTLIFVILMPIIGVFYNFSTNQLIRKCLVTLKQQWFQKIEKQELCEYDIQNASVYISNFTVDINTLEQDYLANLLLVIEYIFSGLASLIVIFSVNYIFIIFVLLTFWIPLLINRLWSKKIITLKLSASQASGNFVSTLKEALTGFEVSKLFGLSTQMESIFRHKNQEAEQSKFKSSFVRDTSSSCSNAASIGIWLGGLLLGTYFVLCKVMTVGSILKVNQLLNNLTNPLYRISSCLTKMKAADKVYQQINSCLAADDSDENSVPESFYGLSNQIELRNLTLNHNERRILNQVNLQFNKGKKYLIVGESGCGKSTLIKLILNYYKDYDGSILIDDSNLKSINKDDWYRCLAVVSQNDFVFHDTIRNNLTLFQSTTETALEEALNYCCLSEFVNSHSEKLDFIIEENGKNISGGERQRICLARALLRNSPVLVLDEATSALDAVTAHQIESNLLSIKDITIISISHKQFPDLIARYDSVIKIENNKIVQSDGVAHKQ